MVAHACNPSSSGGRDQEDCGLRPTEIKSETLSQKYSTQKRASGVAEVVKCLSSKYETLEFKPSKTKKRERIFVEEMMR
jgi:hypothetical protein